LPSHRSPPSGGGAPPAATSAAVAGCRGPPAASHRPPLPAAAVVLRVGGGSGGADGRRSDGRPSAAEKAGAPVVHSVGATAGAEGGSGRHAKSRLYSPVRAAQTATSSTEWASASSHSVSTLCGGPKGPSHIARHIRKKKRTRRKAVGWGRGFVREVSSELRLSSKKIRHKTLVLHRRCREEETRCLSAPPWTPMLCLQSDCPSGPNQTNSDIGRTGSTKIYVAAE